MTNARTSRHAAKKSPPGGVRVGEAEVERRLAVVEELLRDGHARHEVVAAMEQRFAASPRATDDYIRRARARWATEAAATRGTARERTVARLTALARTLEAKGAWGPLVQIERLLADVLGVRAPQQVDVRTAVPPPEEPDMDVEDAVAALVESVPLITSLVQRGSVVSLDRLRRSARELSAAVDARLAEQEATVSGSQPRVAGTARRGDGA